MNKILTNTNEIWTSYERPPQTKVFPAVQIRLNLFVSVCISFTDFKDISRFVHTHISLISVHIGGISYQLPVAGDADLRNGPPVHTGTYTGHTRPDLGCKL